MQLRDRRFLLLGGTGGIGQALIPLLLSEGARLLVATRRPDSITLPEGVTAVKLDLAAENLDQQLQAVTDEWPDLYGVIHCAGQNRFASVEQSTIADIDDQLVVNLRSAMIVAHHFVPMFKALTAVPWCSSVPPSAASAIPATPPIAPPSSACAALPKPCGGNWQTAHCRFCISLPGPRRRR